MILFWEIWKYGEKHSVYFLGYTAQMYGNKDEVGRGLALSGKPRSSYMVTTKVSNDIVG